MALLKLLAMDADDLEVIAATLQDALIKVRDIDWIKSEKRLIMIFKRFAWEQEAKRRFFKRLKKATERNLSTLNFDRVFNVQTHNIDCSKPEEILSLLTIRFEEKDAPTGSIELIFSGGAALRLYVECIEARMADIGPTWHSQSRPSHH